MLKTSSPRRLKIFLCHASDDKFAIRPLYENLLKEGFDVWLDEEELIPGQYWRDIIPEAVRNSDIVVVCLSNRSVSKEGYVQKEVRAALDAADEKPEDTIYLIPAKLEECNVPKRLNNVHWVDLFKERGYEKLVKALDIRAKSLGVETSSSSKQNHIPDSPRKEDLLDSEEQINKPQERKNQNYLAEVIKVNDYQQPPEQIETNVVNNPYTPATTKLETFSLSKTILSVSMPIYWFVWGLSTFIPIHYLMTSILSIIAGLSIIFQSDLRKQFIYIALSLYFFCIGLGSFIPVLYSVAGIPSIFVGVAFLFYDEMRKKISFVILAILLILVGLSALGVFSFYPINALLALGYVIALFFKK